MLVSNAKTLPKIYYGLHFYEGPAEYRPPGKEPYRIMLNEQTLRDMDATFAGCPVYVRHVEEVDLANLQNEADGYVIESFFNKADGKHWCKFIVVSDKGHDALRSGWKLSNAYVPEAFAPGGLWNGIEYAKEVTKAHYEHLAIVPDPRYQDAIVLDPTQFKQYNENHILELQRVANSKEQDLMEPTTMTEPEEKPTENTVAAAPEEKPAEETAAEAKPEMANLEHHVTVGNSTMSVGDLLAKHTKMQDCMNAMAELSTKKEPVQGVPTELGQQQNAVEVVVPVVAPIVEPVVVDSKHFDVVKDAPNAVLRNSAPIEMDGIERGKSRYGSGK